MCPRVVVSLEGRCADVVEVVIFVDVDDVVVVFVDVYEVVFAVFVDGVVIDVVVFDVVFFCW